MLMALALLQIFTTLYLSHTQFLGVYIDEHLTWETHIDNISSKIARGIGIIRKARPYLNKKYFQQLYYY